MQTIRRKGKTRRVVKARLTTPKYLSEPREHPTPPENSSCANAEAFIVARPLSSHSRVILSQPDHQSPLLVSVPHYCPAQNRNLNDNRFTDLLIEDTRKRGRALAEGTSVFAGLTALENL